MMEQRFQRFAAVSVLKCDVSEVVELAVYRTRRSPRWLRSVEKCHFVVAASCAPSQRSVLQRRQKRTRLLCSRYRALHNNPNGVLRLERAGAWEVPQVGGAGAGRGAGCSYGRWSTAGRRRRRRCARRSTVQRMRARQPTNAPVLCLHTTSSSVCASDSRRLHSADRFVARVRQAPRSGCG